MPPNGRAAPARLLLARHGETDWNRERRLQGLTDNPLNATGRAQAAALAARVAALAPDAVYASPLRRALETAEPAARAAGLGVEPHPGLVERDVGAWGGLTGDEVEARWPEDWRRVRAGEDLAAGGGESASDVQARVVAAYAELAARHPGGTLLLVGHGMALKTLLCHLVGLDLRHSARVATGRNCSLTVFEYHGREPRLVVLNDVSHLAPLAAREVPAVEDEAREDGAAQNRSANTIR